MKILLLDMDGTLLTPCGYHLALQETVAFTGRVLGYTDVQLTTIDITTFESAGVISEWDSGAICAALLLENLFQQGFDYFLPAALPSQFHPAHNIPAPNFQAFVHLLNTASLQGLHPLEQARQLFLDNANNRTKEQTQALLHILDTARQMEASFTHRVFQEFVLGSATFERTYNLPGIFDTKSHILNFDRPNISEEDRVRLQTWLQDANHQAVIFTGRPSQSPGKMWSVPETELGAQCVGMEQLPIAGFGGLLWLSAQRECDPLTLLKPAPIHALTGLRLALGDPLETALENAAAFVFNSSDDRSWVTLEGAKVYVFEDSAAGVISLFQAQKILQAAGISIAVIPIGITDKTSKREALEKVGAVVFDTLSGAFGHYLKPDGNFKF